MVAPWVGVKFSCCLVIDACQPIEDVEQEIRELALECINTCQKGKPLSLLWSQSAHFNVSDVYVGSAENNENTQNLDGQNLEGDNLGGVNENAQNVVEKNVYQNVTVVNVEDDNPTSTASEPTYPKSNKAHGNTTSASHYCK
ncbi:hypothetical protein ACLOJK_020653 [Asimina triloba]